LFPVTRIEVRDWDDGVIAFGAAGIVLAAALAVPRQTQPGGDRQAADV
jgi:hypothetical protein